MPLKRGSKKDPLIVESLPAITLGPESVETLFPYPTTRSRSISLTPEPSTLNINDTGKGGKEKRINWTTEMIEQLVEVVHCVFMTGEGSDNGFKKETWIEAVTQVCKVARDSSNLITWDRCKNKWGDLKGKWKHWVKLSEMSGFGWSEEKELFEAYEYVWENLNRAEPNIIWHKTHVMPH
jgi:hypothetical protein